MNYRWIIVDGYSVLHSWPQLRRLVGRSLHEQREALIHVLQQFADHQSCRLTVVFDGYAAKHSPEVVRSPGTIEVLFSQSGKTADDLIERMVGDAGDRDRILVVTSDNLERQTVETLGAHSMSCELFEREAEEALRQLAALIRQHGRKQAFGIVRPGF